MIRCKECGSDAVQCVVWIEPNKEEILDDFGSWGEIDTKYCTRCEDHVGLEDDGVSTTTDQKRGPIVDETDSGTPKGLVRYPIADAECPECNGYGYHAFETNSYTHPPLEIQRDDGCDCCAIRSGHGAGKKASDTDAVLLFAHDLELGVPHAQAIARELLEGGGQRLP